MADEPLTDSAMRAAWNQPGAGRRPIRGSADEPPWVNPDGSTNVDGWLAAYAEDDNTFWRTDSGHIMNVVDALIERLDDGDEDLPVVPRDG